MPFQNAAHDTALGQLQRGRGLGFLMAQELPRSKARRMLSSCILDDPRMDIQCEERSESYADLALKLDLDLNPLVQHLREVRGDEDQEYQSGLVNATLGAMAERGSTAAAEILLEVVRQAHRWDVCLDALVSTGDAELCVRLARIIESRFPTPESLRSALEWQYPKNPAWKRLGTLSDRIQDALHFCIEGRRLRSEERDERLIRLRTLTLRELIQHACTSDQHISREIVQAVVRPEDTAYLQDEVGRWESNWAAYTALAALEAVAVPDISDWLIETMLHHPNPQNQPLEIHSNPPDPAGTGASSARRQVLEPPRPATGPHLLADPRRARGSLGPAATQRPASQTVGGRMRKPLRHLRDQPSYRTMSRCGPHPGAPICLRAGRALLLPLVYCSRPASHGSGRFPGDVRHRMPLGLRSASTRGSRGSCFAHGARGGRPPNRPGGGSFRVPRATRSRTKAFGTNHCFAGTLQSNRE